MKFPTVNRNATGSKSDGSQCGFTLVELSIVLVIIGLIIAAVLKGQELIVSARLKSTISDIDAIRSATNTPRDKFAPCPATMSAPRPVSARRPASPRPIATARSTVTATALSKVPASTMKPCCSGITWPRPT